MIGNLEDDQDGSHGLSLRALEAKIDNRVTGQSISKYER